MGIIYLTPVLDSFIAAVDGQRLTYKRLTA